MRNGGEKNIYTEYMYPYGEHVFFDVAEVYNLGMISFKLHPTVLSTKVLLSLLVLLVIFTHREHIYYPTLLKVSNSF